MGIETRKGNIYYYRKRREGARVISEYMGGSLIALDAARLFSDLEESRADERRLEQVRRERETEFDEHLDQISRDIDLMTEAALVAVGYRLHNREWRMKR